MEEKVLDEKALKKKKRRIRRLITLAIIVALITALAIYGNESNYKEGVELWQEGRYSAAVIKFHRSGLRHDSKDYVAQFEEMVRPELVKFVWCGADHSVPVNGNPSQLRHASWRLWFYEDGTCTQELISKFPEDKKFQVAHKTTMYWDFGSTGENLEIQLRLKPDGKVTARYTCYGVKENGQFQMSLITGTFVFDGEELSVPYTPFLEENLVIH